MKNCEVSKATIGRLPVYLKYLRENKSADENISATAIAKELGMGEVRVRKDLASVSGAGRPRVGYNVGKLTGALEDYLSGDTDCVVVIVGAGKLGRALLDYSGFSEYGIEVAAAFDNAVTSESSSASGKPILPMSSLHDYCRDNNVKIGIIAVPASSAQEVCDRLVDCHVKGVWCFAPTKLTLPANVQIQYENMALSLAYLGKKI